MAQIEEIAPDGVFFSNGPGDPEAATEEVDLLRSVLESRKRVMLELNVASEFLSEVVAILPCMRQPTVSTLNGDAGFAVKAAVPRAQLASLIPQIKGKGGTDIVVTSLAQIVP